MQLKLVNNANAHTFTGGNTEGAVVGCQGKGMGSDGKCGVVQYIGGKRKTKKRRRSTKKRQRRKHPQRRHRSSKRRKRGGSTVNRLNPREGMNAMLSRGENATRSGGFSLAEKATLKGGYGPTPKTRKINLYLTQMEKDAQLAKDIRASKTGGGYAYTTASAAKSFGPHDLGQGYNRHSTVPISAYKNCGIVPNFKMGASSNYVGTQRIQKGAGAAGYPGHNTSPITVDAYNQYNNSSYGYTNGSQNDVLRGSYAPITNLSHKQQCKLSGGRKKKKGGMSLLTDAYKSVMAVPGDIGSKVNQAAGDVFIPVTAAGGGKRKKRKTRKRKTKKRRKYKKRRSKKQRGGYAQYQSNVPLTWTQQIPAGPGGSTWEGQLANPPTYIRTDNCHNNYNHYTGKNTPSPVLDQAAPSKSN